jgi:hypothetical protein
MNLKNETRSGGRFEKKLVADRTERADVITLNTICSRISYLLLTELRPG